MVQFHEPSAAHARSEIRRNNDENIETEEKSNKQRSAVDHETAKKSSLANLKNKCFIRQLELGRRQDNDELQCVKEISNLDRALTSDGSLVCITDDFECNDRSIMTAHQEKKHSDTNIEDTFSGKRDFVCITCGLVCSRKETLRSHFVRKHTQRYGFSCTDCGKEFKIKGDLTTHIRLNHRESPVICDVCGKTCRNSHSLYTHQKHAHYKPKYECPHCHRRLVTKENLDQHVLTQHEKKEKSVCEECGKTFFESYDLKKHMRIHTGDKPYSCTVCNRAFSRHSSLSQHLLLHTGERIYSCDVCGKSFAQKAGLICHRKIHSGALPPLPVIHIDHILKCFAKK